jgi:hypothetical protein
MPKKLLSQQIDQTATGNENIQVAGSHNVITRITNLFVSDNKTTDQHTRRIMLGHMENFWVKGILEKSLYGMALLDLGIKEDPDVLSYPWAIKRETAKETLPAGTSMLEIFQKIGMGRSLLILGAPGAGKTITLLALTRELIELARQDVTEPIPVVFNLSSWIDKLTLEEWLVRELNTIYLVPENVALRWIKENKMLLLLDGLDEVKQASRDKCVDAINQFRTKNGLTSVVVCSRIRDYAQLKTRLSFDGAIEIQPLTSNQINAYFRRFGKRLAGISQVLKKDTVLLEMAETPLFLSIMTLAYRDTKSSDILISGDLGVKRKHLFDTYIERMLEPSTRTTKPRFSKQQTLHYLHCLARMMVNHNSVTYQIEAMQPSWLEGKSQSRLYRLFLMLFVGLLVTLFVGLFVALFVGMREGLIVGLSSGLIFGLITVLSAWENIIMIDKLKWSWKGAARGLLGGLLPGLVVMLCTWLIVWLLVPPSEAKDTLVPGLIFGLIAGLILWLILGIFGVLIFGLIKEQMKETTYPGQRLKQTLLNAVFVGLIYGLIFGLLVGLIAGFLYGLGKGLIVGLSAALIFGLIVGLFNGGNNFIQHFALRFVLILAKLLPRDLVPFLDYCVDRIFLRRVGGGYIFVHRLLMEHFAAMYPLNEK